MKIDNATSRQLAVGLDAARNASKTHQAEPGAFGQLFASLTRTPQEAPVGAAEAAPTAHAANQSADQRDDDAKVQADSADGNAGDTQHADKSDEGQDDAVQQSSAGAVGVKADQQQEDRAKGNAEADADGDGAKSVGDKGVASAKPQAAEQVATIDVQIADQGPAEQKTGPLQVQVKRQPTQASVATVNEQLKTAPAGDATEPVLPQVELNAAADEQFDQRKQNQKNTDAAKDAGSVRATNTQATSVKPRDTVPAAEKRGHQTQAQQTPDGQGVTAANASNVQAQADSNQKGTDTKAASVNAVRTGGADAGALQPTTIAAGAAPAHAQPTTQVASNTGAMSMPDSALTDEQAQQVAAKALGSVRSIASQGSGQGAVTLRLNPPELGALRISVRMDGPMLSATFEASSASVSSLLRSQMHTLRTALEHAGLGVEQLNVRSPSPPPTTNGAHFSSTQQQMHQSPSDGRSRGMLSDGGRQSNSQSQQREQQPSTAGFQQELLNLVA